MVLSVAPHKMLGHYPGVSYTHFLSNAVQFIPHSSLSHSRTYSVGF